MEERRFDRSRLADLSADFNPAATYPMVTIVHGGPSAASVPIVRQPQSQRARIARLLRLHAQSARQLRTRRGIHAEPTSRISATATGGTTRPASTRRSKRRPSIPNRLGLMGWSYGGYMAMWGETQTTRFKAIVAGAGIVNWQSYYGQNKIDQWMIPFFGASVYQDPAVYAQSSPITFIMQSKTPVLILQGRARRRSARAAGVRVLACDGDARRSDEADCLCRRRPRTAKDRRSDRHFDADGSWFNRYLAPTDRSAVFDGGPSWDRTRDLMLIKHAL